MKKRMLSILLALAMCLSLLPAAALAANDLRGHWAEDIVAQWQEKGYVSGYGDGSFRPDAPITRAAFVKLMNRAVGFTEEAVISFTDVAESDWYYHEVARAISAGYTQGYEDGTFRPDRNITRAEAAVMIAKATGLTAQESAADGFSDEIPAWARGSVGAVAAAGFMIGYTDGTFGADATITRAAAVVALDRVAKKVQGTVTITEPGTTLEDQVIGGDLIVAESVGNGNVYLKNVTVVGSTYVRGGGSHSFYAENSRFSGTVHMQKNGLHMGLSGTTEIGDMQMEKPSSITFEKDFSGTVKNLNIPKDAPAGKYAIEAANKNTNPVENMSVDSKAELSLGANVSKMTIGENAKDSSITVEKDATVDSMEVHSKTEITGKGTVGNMDVGASGVTTGQDLTVKDTTTSNGAAAPTTKPSGSYNTTGSGTAPAKPTVTITPSTYGIGSTTGSTMKHVYFTATGATLTKEDISITVTAENAGGTRNLPEGAAGYQLTIRNSAIMVDLPGFEYDTKYTVEIKASSIGSSKYNITGYTYKHNGINKVTWQTGTNGIADIIPGTTIGAGTASVTFTVDGATINNRAEAITAKLNRGSAESSEIDVTDKIAISTDKKSITVDLAGQNLSVGDYTLTLSVHGYRLDASTNRYAPKNDTVTATFTVATRPVALGETTTSTLPKIESEKTVPDGAVISFPVTGIASVTGATATISPSGSGITADVTTEGSGGSVSNVVVTLGGTAPTVTAETTYTLTLTIPSGGITTKDGYTTSGDLSQTLTFTVQPASVPEVTVTGGGSLELKAGEEIPADKTITLYVTGASALTTSGIKVIAFQSGYEVEITSTGVFTTSATGGTLVLTFSGTAPIPEDGKLALYSNGLKVVIPKENFTAMAGYTVPSEDIVLDEFKFVLNPASTSGE